VAEIDDLEDSIRERTATIEYMRKQEYSTDLILVEEAYLEHQLDLFRSMN
jgi:hypothetical protein